MKKQTGYGDIVPMLHVRDLIASVAFYRDVLGFDIDQEMRSIDFAMLWASEGSGEIWQPLALHSIDAEHPAVRGQSILIQVDNLADMLERHRSNGATILFEITDRPWGVREYGIEDPDGYRLLFREGGYDVR